MDQTVYYYLWVSHGAEIGYSNVVTPYETKLNCFHFYGRQYYPLVGWQLEYFLNNPSENFVPFVTSAQVVVPIINENGERKLYIHASTYNIDDISTVKTQAELISFEYIKRFTGLYFFAIQKNGGQFNIHGEKIVDYDAILKRYGGNRIITYNNIESIVMEHLKSINVNPSNAVLGFYACRSNNNYAQMSATDFLLYKPMVDTSMYNTLIKGDPVHNNLSLVTIPVSNEITQREALVLLGTTGQGCAVDLLHYYGIIDKIVAENMIAAQDSCGMSIFSIADILWHYKQRFTEKDPYKYICYRFTTPRALEVIVNNLYFYRNSTENHAVIFKLYKGAQSTTHKLPGHSISLLQMGTKLWLMDVQLQKWHDISLTQPVETVVSQTLEVIQTLFSSHTVADIIYENTPEATDIYQSISGQNDMVQVKGGKKKTIRRNKRRRVKK